MSKNLFYPYSSFLLKLSLVLCVLWQHPVPVYGAGEAALAIVSDHLRQDAALLEELLQPVEQAQLHFFWATGRTLSDNPNYNPHTKVQVGGADYGDKFFPYVDALLENSPSKLKVKFICDAMTRTSNADAIETLEAKHGSRFEVVDVRTVHTTLLQVFTTAEQTHKINLVFNNATRGNPVIPSDVYRIIGMVYGHAAPESLQQTQYTYCDIDTFCYGMEISGQDRRGLNHTDLVKALFRPSLRSSFYLAKTRNNNDLIKLYVHNPISYKKFCDLFLTLMPEHRVLSYFSELHDIIEACEKTPEAFKRQSSLRPLGESLKDAILSTTGCYLLDKTCAVTVLDESYPAVFAGEWFGAEELLGYSSTSIDNQLNWVSFNPTPQQERAQKYFKSECQFYAKELSVALYAKRFGVEHPFNLQLKAALKEDFPYNTPAFKALLRLNFEDAQTEDPSYERWLNSSFQHLTQGSYLTSGTLSSQDGYAMQLLYLLKKLGVEVPFTPSSLDFRAP